MMVIWFKYTQLPTTLCQLEAKISINATVYLSIFIAFWSYFMRNYDAIKQYVTRFDYKLTQM